MRLNTTVGPWVNIHQGLDLSREVGCRVMIRLLELPPTQSFPGENVNSH